MVTQTVFTIELKLSDCIAFAKTLTLMNERIVKKEKQNQIKSTCIISHKEIYHIKNSETQRLVQNVILKLEKINVVFVKLVMVKHQ